MEAPAAGAVQANEVRITEPADGAGAIDFTPRPEVTAGEPAEHRRAAGLSAFALQGEEDLLDRVAHAECAAWAFVAQLRQPFARRSQAGQTPQP